MKKLVLKPGELTLADLRAVWCGHVPVELDSAAYEAINAAKGVVDDVIAGGKTVYSINTGFGELARVRIEEGQFEKLQQNLLLSHATGVGKFLKPHTIRLILLMKINALAQGYSGVRAEIVDALLGLYQNEVYPCVPAKGSVGASGDLAPLAHLCLPLLGLGQVLVDGEVVDAAKGLEKAGLEPMGLAPKEGLALLNGTQVSTALALCGLFEAEDCFAAAMVAGMLSVDAAKGSSTPFYPEIHKVRRQQGQMDTAEVYRALLKGSEIRDSHRDEENDEKVQDPYCLRCQPQVMGACLDHLRFAAEVFEREANAVTDNPLVFPETGDVWSGGNFHAEPVGMAADTLALAIAEVGAISERRIALLTDSKMSGLPAFLVNDAGVNSGFMIAHVTAAALASENKQLAHPAVVDSIPTSANQEDHVSMATHGARRLVKMTDNIAHIIGIELLAAAQGVDFHAPLKTSPALLRAMKLIRDHIDPYTEDKYFAPDIRQIKRLVETGAFLEFVDKDLLPSLSS